ncbi:MAG: hypothetical protein IPK93_03760 [Solirubrobacterales bacterium]|nr:hypothetical protein [Solirubrobacterales bacterium]
MTNRGFFSIVDKGDREDCLCIRGRVRGDMDNLLKLEPLKHYAEAIQESDLGDYRFRVYVSRDDWIMAAALLAEEINYPNFKDEVKRKQGPERAGTYLEVWSDLYELQR